MGKGLSPARGFSPSSHPQGLSELAAQHVHSAGAVLSRLEADFHMEMPVRVPSEQQSGAVSREGRT